MNELLAFGFSKFAFYTIVAAVILIRAGRQASGGSEHDRDEDHPWRDVDPIIKLGAVGMAAAAIVYWLLMVVLQAFMSVEGFSLVIMTQLSFCCFALSFIVVRRGLRRIARLDARLLGLIETMVGAAAYWASIDLTLQAFPALETHAPRLLQGVATIAGALFILHALKYDMTSAGGSRGRGSYVHVAIGVLGGFACLVAVLLVQTEHYGR